jgi:hypothetical protein
MPESKTDVLIWDGSQTNFTILEDKVFERFLDGSGGRTTQQWCMNSDASITGHNKEEFGIALWNMQRLKAGIKKAEEDAYLPMHFGRSNMPNHGGRSVVFHFAHGPPLMPPLPLVTSLLAVAALSRRPGEMMFGRSEDRSTKPMALERPKTSGSWKKSSTKLNSRAGL